MMAEAASYNVDKGADIIDINMGCPAKKICNVAAGLGAAQGRAAGGADRRRGRPRGGCPVTRKIRYRVEQGQPQCAGDREDRRKITASSRSPCTGRTRACMYTATREYDTIRAVKQSVRIPVVANATSRTPEKAKFVLEYTGADAVMIGARRRAGPELHARSSTTCSRAPSSPRRRWRRSARVMVAHLHDCTRFYGLERGVRVARKHIGWYTKGLKNSAMFARG
jgi:tRNA-dihydrouridine synthase B